MNHLRSILCVLAVQAAIACLCGCVTSPPACDRGCVSSKIVCRMGHTIGSPPVCSGLVLPNGASLADGLTEEEAVLIALWNNAAFQELLVELDLADADLVQAGLLPNPEVVYFFPVTEKPYKYALDFPLESLWLRPIRIAAAGRESARVCERLAQAGLDLIRDTRLAYTDVLLAKGRLRVAEEAVGIRSRVSELADIRVRAGEASPLEVATARVDAIQARQDVVRAGFDVQRAEEPLHNLLGLSDDRKPLSLIDIGAAIRHDLNVEALAADATASRPDLLAASEAVAAADERARLARVGWIRFLGILDATSGRGTGHEFGPAFRATLPVFNHNEGAIARADAEWDRAVRQRETVRQRILLEVHDAHLRYVQAIAELDIVEANVLPEVEAGIRRIETAYREGNISYVVVLESTRQLLDARLRQEQLRAATRQAWAEMERSVGRRIASPELNQQAPPIPQPLPPSLPEIPTP